MKKVLFLIHDLGQGGAEKVLVNLVNNMDHEQFDVTVMTLFDVGVNKQFLSKKVRYKTVFSDMIPGNSHLMKLFSPKMLHKLFINDKYDIEISYLEGPCARIISGCPDPDTRLVCWIHREMKSLNFALQGFRNEAEAVRCYDAFHKIIGVSQYVVDDFQRVLNVRTPLEVVYNTNESEVILEKATEEVTECQFSDAEIKMIGVGKLIKSKGFDRLLRITKRLHEDGNKVHLYILGTGSEKDGLEQYIAENHMQTYVNMLGYQTNPYKFVKRCDLFVCASFAEGFSTAATEALIVGTPVCTVDVSGMKEMLGNNNQYGIVTENNEESLYNGIKMLLQDIELLYSYKERAIERGRLFETKTTVKAVEEKFCNLFNNWVGKK